MEPNAVTERAEEYLQETGRYVRENPVPLLLGAVAVGFLLGLAARQLDRQRKHEPIHDALDEIRGLVSQLGFATETAQQTSDRHWTWKGERGASAP